MCSLCALCVCSRVCMHRSACCLSFGSLSGSHALTRPSLRRAQTEIPGSKTYDVHEALVDRQKKMQRDSKHVRWVAVECRRSYLFVMPSFLAGSWVDINGQDDDLMDTIVAELQLPLALKEDVSFEQQVQAVLCLLPGCRIARCSALVALL